MTERTLKLMLQNYIIFSNMIGGELAMENYLGDIATYLQKYKRISGILYALSTSLAGTLNDILVRFELARKSIVSSSFNTPPKPGLPCRIFIMKSTYT